ncbi:PhzF family phenazine biosynthesis protein [Sphingomonas koreensis]
MAVRELKFGFVDVFAEHPLQGNPLAVVEGGDDLSDEKLRAIAHEFNQSETTFLQSPTLPSADWRLRSFTASGVEVGGAGHNALGAWLWLGYQGKLGNLEGPRTFVQELGGVVLPVRMERRGALLRGTMTHSPLQLRDFVPDPASLAASLGLRLEDIETHPMPRVAWTGAGHLLVRVRDAAAVDRAAPTADALLAALGAEEDRGCYIYALNQGVEARAYARFFNPSIGLYEDPATGSAAGPLGGYLHHSGLLERGQALIIEQGTKMGRRSVLEVLAGDDITLSGPGVVVMTGLLRVE